MKQLNLERLRNTFLCRDVVSDVLESNPKMGNITQPLSDKLDDDVMRHLNYQVDVEGKNVRTVTRNWLVEYGLLGRVTSGLVNKSVCASEHSF